MGIQMQKNEIQILRHVKQKKVKVTAAIAKRKVKKALTSVLKSKDQAKGPQAGCSKVANIATIFTNVPRKRKSQHDFEIHRTSAPATYNIVDDIISKSTLPPNVKPTASQERIRSRPKIAASTCKNVERVFQGKKNLMSNTSLTKNVLTRKRKGSPSRVPAAGTTAAAGKMVRSPRTDTNSSTPRQQQVPGKRKKKKKQRSSAQTNQELTVDVTKRVDKKHVVLTTNASAAVRSNAALSNITRIVPQQPVTVVVNVVTPRSSPLAEGAFTLSGNKAHTEGTERYQYTSSQYIEVKQVATIQTTEQSWPEDAEMEDLSGTITQSINEQQPLVDYKGIYLVTDTNVFLHHLSLVKQIINADTGNDTYIVCVPWVVIQELDRIRNHRKENNKALSATAFQAILYINRLLETKNPKLRGQTIAEARSKNAMMPSDGHNTNDDHLLCCCLSLRQQGSRVILMTNDTNLRNKAIINGIESFGARIVEKNLKGILAKTCIEVETENCPALEETHRIILQGAQAVWEKVTQILQHCLSVVLCMELKSALGDNWLEQVAVRPPWTALSALECVLKHWQDCHLLPSSALNSTIAPNVKALSEMLKDFQQGIIVHQPNVERLQELFGHSVKICSHLQLHYFHLAEEVATLRYLEDGWMQHTKATPAAASLVITADTAQDQGMQRTPCIPQRPLIYADANLQRPAATVEPPTMPQSEEQARQCIQLLQDSWSLINDFCGTASRQVSRCYEYPYQENPRYVSSMATLQTVYKHVYQTREHMQRLLRRHPVDLMVDVASMFLETLQMLVHFLLEKVGRPKVPFRVTSSQMVLFFQDGNRRDLLDNGYKQIVTFQDALGYCLLAATEQETTRKASSGSSSSSSNSSLWN